MAIAHIDLALLLPFDPFTDPSSVGQRWTSWLRRFETYLLAMDITDVKRKHALLLYQGAEDEYKTAVDTLSAYFLPKRNVIYEIFQCHQAKQLPGESVHQYSTRLRHLAATCECADIDSEIEADIIQNCTSKRLRRYAIREEMVTLANLLATARAFEVSDHQAKGMEYSLVLPNSITPKQETAHLVRSGRNGPSFQRMLRATKSYSSPSSVCGNCGFHLPHKGHCPARGQSCRACGKANHFAKVCRSKKNVLPHKPGRKAHINNVTNHRESIPRSPLQSSFPARSASSSEDEYLFMLGNSNIQGKTPKATVMINGTQVKMVIDTGASTDILDKETFDGICIRDPIRLEKSNAQIFAYGSTTPLKVLGQFETVIESKTTMAVSTSHVLSGRSGSLLSYTTARNLGLIALPLNSVSTTAIPTSQDLRDQYPQLFKGIGQLHDFEVTLHIDPSVPPVAQAARRIPCQLRKKVATALDNLLQHDIIERVDGPTPYVSPLVVLPKKDGEVRLCIDMRIPNKAIQRERYPNPTVDDLITEMNGATTFSKLDLHSGYHQLTLHPDSHYITTFATHKGLYRYKRLHFGTNSASEIFQKAIHEQIRTIPGVINISDDIIVSGKTSEDHNKSLLAVFNKLSQVGLTLDKGKCLFDQRSLPFFGFVFSDEGILPNLQKVSAIHSAPLPTSVSAFRSFLRMATYCAKVIPNFSHITEPLRALTKKNTIFQWTDKHEHAFQDVKQALTSDTVVCYFDQSKDTELVTDASPYGLSAILSQKIPGTDDRKVISYISHSLSVVERRYSQTDREALAIVWAIERLNTYLYGGHFTLYTDCKPAELILNNPKSKPPARIERWNLRLQDYDFIVVYTKGQTNPSVFLSRHLTTATGEPHHVQNVKCYVHFLTSHAVPKAMTITDLQITLEHDSTLKHLVDILQGRCNWDLLTSQNRQTLIPCDVNKRELLQFYHVRDELSLTSDGKVVLRGPRVVLPHPLRHRAVHLAHEGHQGLVKTKTLVREKVWFPGSDTFSQDIVSNCLACQANGPDIRPDPLCMTSLPPEPWHTLNIDFCGPFPTGEYLLVVIDACSRFPEVEIITSTSARATMPKLEQISEIYMTICKETSMVKTGNLFL